MAVRCWVLDRFVFFMCFGCFLDSGRRDDRRLAFTSATRRKNRLPHDAFRMEAKLAGFSFLAENVK